MEVTGIVNDVVLNALSNVFIKEIVPSGTLEFRFG